EALKNVDKVRNLANAATKRLAAFVAMIEGFKKSVNSKVAPVIERVFAESGLQQSLKDVGTEAKNALDNVEELINKAAEYDKDTEEPSLLDFLQQISLFSDVDTYDAAAGRVALMTLHNTKGLEFEAAFITGLEDGILPHERSSEDDDDIEEERRLFFVGITRAKSHLFISFAQYRTIRGQQLRTIPSQFLYELGIETTQQQDSEYVYEDVDDEDTSSDYETFKKGQPVRHPSFGRGTIKEFHDMGQNSGQTKTLMLKYAKLEKI
ncbi:MAG: 3'-5' exonuclease, partial [Planctomycetota bacterium]